MSTSKEAGRRGRPRRTSVDAAILAATLRLLSEQGYARMTVDGVAQTAGVGKPTIYRRYHDKADLAAAALASLRGDWEVQETDDPRADAVAYVKSARRNIFSPGDLSLLGTMLAEERHNPDFLRRFQERVIKPRRARLNASLLRARDAGDLAPAADLELMVDMLVGPLLSRYLGGRPVASVSPERLVERVWRAFAPE